VYISHDPDGGQCEVSIVTAQVLVRRKTLEHGPTERGLAAFLRDQREAQPQPLPRLVSM